MDGGRAHRQAVILRERIVTLAGVRTLAGWCAQRQQQDRDTESHGHYDYMLGGSFSRGQSSGAAV
jgi:hypothetical protein